MLGVVAGWWTTTRSGWYGKQEKGHTVHCFLAWLEREVGDPKAKHQDFGLTVIGTARYSGFTLMDEARRRGVDEEKIARWAVDLARKHRYVWRRDDFRKWASEVASKSD